MCVLKVAVTRLNLPCSLDCCSQAERGGPANLSTCPSAALQVEMMYSYLGSRLPHLRCLCIFAGGELGKEKQAGVMMISTYADLDTQRGIRCNSPKRCILLFHTTSGVFFWEAEKNFTRSLWVRRWKFRSLAGHTKTDEPKV